MIEGNDVARGRILVVDDEPAVLHLICRNLSREGFDVEEAKNGKEALDKALTWGPELILMDVEMQGMDGIETCRQLKTFPQIAAIPVIFLTGRGDDEQTAVEALTAGGRDFVLKNAATPVLIARLLSSLEVYRAQLKLEAANRELEAFSDSIAHDLKNPLLTVTQFSAYLEQALVDSLDEQQQDFLRRIRAAGRHMTHIIDDLRDLADVNRGEIGQEEVDYGVSI